MSVIRVNTRDIKPGWKTKWEIYISLNDIEQSALQILSNLWFYYVTYASKFRFVRIFIS